MSRTARGICSLMVASALACASVDSNNDSVDACGMRPVLDTTGEVVLGKTEWSSHGVEVGDFLAGAGWERQNRPGSSRGLGEDATHGWALRGVDW